VKRLAAPAYFYQQATKLIPWLSVVVGVLLTYGVLAGLFIAPNDYQT